MIMAIHNTFQKPMLRSIRSFGTFTSAITRTIRTLSHETSLEGTNHSRMKLFRYSTLSRRISFEIFSTNHCIVGRGYDAQGGGKVRQYHNEQHEEHQFMKGTNPGLASVISQGMKSLEQTAEEIQYKTRKITLSQPHRKPSFRNGRAAELDPRQLAEGQRVLDVASDCLEQLALQKEQGGWQQRSIGGSNGLVLSGEPIVLLECEVNRNVRQAKIYWTLPYEILLDNRINQQLYQKIMVKVQKELVENGGAKLLVRNVNTRLSYYYPPRIKLFPATDEMVQRAIEEFLA